MMNKHILQGMADGIEKQASVGNLVRGGAKKFKFLKNNAKSNMNKANYKPKEVAASGALTVGFGGLAASSGIENYSGPKPLTSLPR